MSANPATTFVTPEEYLERELESEEKNEYFNGEVFAIARPSPRHTLIVMNVAGGFWRQLKGKPCWVYPNELRLRVTPTGLYTYPDVMVICGDVQFDADQKGTVLNPVVIVEVLSKSTEYYDLSQKSRHYRSLPSLTDYLAIAQVESYVQHWTRQADRGWLVTEFSDLTQTIHIPSVDCTLPLTEIYDKIDFTSTADLN